MRLPRAQSVRLSHLILKEGKSVPQPANDFVRFWVRAWLALLLVSYSLAAASLVWDHDLKYTEDFGRGSQTPQWSNGALIALEVTEGAPVVRTFDRQGVELTPLAFRIPEATSTDALGVARGSDGTMALCGSAVDPAGRVAHYIALVAPSGYGVQVIRTLPYLPILVTIASDGTIWTAGDPSPTGKEDPSSLNAGVVRHFDRTGKEIGSYIPRSSLASPNLLLDGHLAAGRDRICWYPGGPNQFGPSEYVEISADGTITRFPPTPLMDHEVTTGMAVTDDAGTFLSIRNLQSGTWGILSLDKTQAAWVRIKIPAELASSPFSTLKGADGNKLVFTNGRGRLTFVTATR